MLRLLLKPKFNSQALIIIPDGEFFQTSLNSESFKMYSGTNLIATFPVDHFSSEKVWELLPQALLMAMDLGRDSLVINDYDFAEIYAELHSEWMEG